MNHNSHTHTQSHRIKHTHLQKGYPKEAENVAPLVSI